MRLKETDKIMCSSDDNSEYLRGFLRGKLSITLDHVVESIEELADIISLITEYPYHKNEILTARTELKLQELLMALRNFEHDLQAPRPSPGRCVELTQEQIQWLKGLPMDMLKAWYEAQNSG